MKTKRIITPKYRTFALATLFFLSLSMVMNNAGAANYYVSATGSDAANGLTKSTAWLSIAKVNSNFNSFNPGDSILFKCGDSFYGSIVVTRSGVNSAPIIISSYGTGAKPVITGLTAISSWVSVGNGIYQADASSLKNTVNLVTLNNMPQAVGRFPNADAPGGGYLTYETYSYSGGATITDNQLNDNVNWKGAEVVIRKNHWHTERCLITDHTGTTLKYIATNPFDVTTTPAPTYGADGYGYFIQRDPKTLDQLGEWYFDTVNKKLLMYFGTVNPNLSIIKASSQDILINIGTQVYVSVSNISFEGADKAAVYAKNSGNLIVEKCNINLMGTKGIYMFNTPNVLIESVNTNNVLSNAIDVTNRHVANVTVRNCVIKNTGTLSGMGFNWDDNEYKALSVYSENGGLIEYNKVDTTGFMGIQFQGNDFTVQKNVVNYYDFVKDDGGGIYNYVSGEYFTNRKINNNIVMNGIGAPVGAGGNSDVDGIYIDGSPMNIDIFNNTIFNIGNNGIYCNNPVKVNITNNTCFNNGCAIGITRYCTVPLNNLTIKQNIFYPKTNTQGNFYYTDTGLNVPVVTTLQDAMIGIGDIDNNYLATPNATGFGYSYRLTENSSWLWPKPMTFEGWKSFTNHDLASTLPPVKIELYKLDSLIKPNLVSNGQFALNINGMNIWSPSVTVNSVLDINSKITGTGSLKITPATSSTDYTLIYGAIGAVSSSKKYIFRFTTLGEAANGALRAYIRKTGSPYTSLIPAQVANFGTSKITHEFLFTAPTTDAGASFVIEIQQSSGATYIDDIEFYEAAATVLNIDDQLRFEYNATNDSRTINLGTNYIGADRKVYNGSITLQPYTSAILMKSGLMEINNTPSIINQSFQIAKNSANGKSVGTVLASDPDAGQTLEYSIVSGNTNGAFSINASTGLLSVANATALNSDFALVVKVQDNGSGALSNQATITINIISTPGNDKTVKVYPNPVSDELIIEIQGNTDSHGFEILNLSGQIVYKGNFSERIVVPIASISPGIYLIKLENGKSFEYKKFVKL